MSTDETVTVRNRKKGTIYLTYNSTMNGKLLKTDKAAFPFGYTEMPVSKYLEVYKQNKDILNAYAKAEVLALPNVSEVTDGRKRSRLSS